jgi:hypothetical protein
MPNLDKCKYIIGVPDLWPGMCQAHTFNLSIILLTFITYISVFSLSTHVYYLYRLLYSHLCATIQAMKVNVKSGQL